MSKKEQSVMMCTHKGRAHVLDLSNILRVPAGREDVFDQTIPLDSETQSRPIAQPRDPQTWRLVRKRKRK